MIRRMLLPTALVTASLALATPARAQPAPLPYMPHQVATPDGVVLNVQEWGNPQGPEILFIHGGQQAWMSWARQVADPTLLAEFRMITFDLRGHGMSGQPVGDQYYKVAKPWADDIAALIATLRLRQPTLVGWSYGGRVIADYLIAHGQQGIAAINFVAAVTSAADRSRFGPGVALLAAASSADMPTFIEGNAGFLRACFEIQPSTAEFQTMLAYNIMTPRHVRLSMLGRAADYDAVLSRITVPTLVTQGELDRVILPSLSRFTLGIVPGSVGSFYAGVGHSPFWEDAPRFNRELAELVRRAATARR
jgi:pimeloyl-ACP methyl ester carboxylesterase